MTSLLQRMGFGAFFITVLLIAAVAHASEPRAAAPPRHPLVDPSAPVRLAPPNVADPHETSAVPESERPTDLGLESKPAYAQGVSGADRAEFITFQLAYGLFDGSLLASFGSHDVMPVLGELAVRGVGSALLSTLVPSFTASQVMAINAWTFWGNAWSALLAFAFEGKDGFTYPALLGTIGGAAGSVAGLIIGSDLQPDPAVLSMANSCAFWAGVLAYLARGPFSRTNDDWKLTFGAIELASVGGFLVGGVLLPKVGVALRSETLAVDLGGLIGAFVGWLMMNQLGASRPNQTMLRAVTTGGFTLGGLGAGIALARAFAVARSGSQLPAVSIAPMGRDGVGLAVQSAF